MIKYDKDQSRSLDIGELNAFFTDHLPDACKSGVYQQVVDIVYPEKHRQVRECLGRREWKGWGGVNRGWEAGRDAAERRGR